MTLDQEYTAIDKLEATKVLPTKTIVGVILAMFIGVQAIFIIFKPSDEAMWQATGMIVSTNFAAVWLTVRGNQQIEDVQETAKSVYRPEILKFVNWQYALFRTMAKEIDDEPEDLIEDLSPVVAKILVRYAKEKRRLERLSKIDDDEVFMDAVKEMTR